MSRTPTQPAIRVDVDLTNPGQFFACCGLLELADRLWTSAAGWFEQGQFCIAADRAPAKALSGLLQSLVETDMVALEPTEPTISPLKLEGKFVLRLDWWLDERAGGTTYKTWAGQQKVLTIASAMHRAMGRAMFHDSRLFDFAEIVPDPESPKQSVAPFYFDARRAAGALNLDVGFSTDAQAIETLSFPTVEFLCLVGLQRFRPQANSNRTFTYFAWSKDTPLVPSVAASVACGAAPLPSTESFTFRLLFRTKYLKGFLPATSQGATA